MDYLLSVGLIGEFHIETEHKYKIQVNISHILKDVVGFKFIVFREHNFGGQYLVLGYDILELTKEST